MITDCLRSSSLPLGSLRFTLYATALAASALAAQASQNSGSPYPSRFIKVRGVSMHYVEVGQGDPILLLHGNPASAYIWRNVIPLLTNSGRVIAVDLVGFGKSGKPNIDYRLADHATYLEGFIEALGLRKITLVMHDWGSALGFDYASRHPENVCALAFFEALLAPVPPLEQWPNQQAAEQFRRYRTPGLGWELIVNQNEFIEKRLQQGILRKLTEEELRHYREPFKNRRSRKPIWRWPNELPIAGDPPDVAAVQAHYLQWLASTHKPKLLLFAHPGALTPEQVVAWARANLQNLEAVDLWLRHSQSSGRPSERNRRSNLTMATENSLYIKGNAVTRGSLLWRAFLLIDAIVLTAAAFAACYQVVRTRRDRREFPPPGRLVAVGNFWLHIDCVGERSPTVVVVPGTGVWSAQWTLIQRDLAKDARVCTYDRAGFGWSDPATSPRTAQQAAFELHELLASASESSPYLLVGESYGGYVVRLFHEEFPRQVAGIVLVESAHERQWEEIPEAKLLLEQAEPKLKIGVWLSRLGFFRWKAPDSGADLPEDARASFRAAQAHTQTFQAILAELGGVFTSTQQVSETHRLGSLPLVVVSAARSFNKFVTADKEPQLDQMNRKWLQLQQELAGLSDNSVHLVSPEATHGIAREQPELVTKAIRQALQLARSQQR